MAASRRPTRSRAVAFSLGLLGVLICFALPHAAAQFPIPQNDGTVLSHPGSHKMSSIPDDPTLRNDGPPTLTTVQKQYIVRSNLAKSKSDAAELAALAKELREALNKPEADVLSAAFTNRLDKIEKLAKKIRDETKGF